VPWLHLVSHFFGGAFLTNSIPHFVSGLMGRPFQSPFAKPPGEGVSSSTVNVWWGAFNLVVGYFLVLQVGEFALRNWPDATALGLDVLMMALISARLFGRFHGGNSPNQG
jgi:hypothetical protein